MKGREGRGETDKQALKSKYISKVILKQQWGKQSWENHAYSVSLASLHICQLEKQNRNAYIQKNCDDAEVHYFIILI